MRNIRLYLDDHKYNKQQSARCWISAHYDEDKKPDLAVIDLFGTHILPTAYTEHASGSMVLAKIQSLNPNHVVVITQ